MYQKPRLTYDHRLWNPWRHPRRLDPAARARHDLWLHTAGVNQLRRRVEDLENETAMLTQAAWTVLESYAAEDEAAIKLAVERLRAVLEAEE